MNLQLYMVDSINYLVDFHHKRTYKASTEPGAGKYDMPSMDAQSEAGSDSAHGGSDVVSPFVFMDVACRLILELASILYLRCTSSLLLVSLVVRLLLTVAIYPRC
jgi:carbon catabolite-derepressing protein kinase